MYSLIDYASLEREVYRAFSLAIKETGDAYKDMSWFMENQIKLDNEQKGEES